MSNKRKRTALIGKLTIEAEIFTNTARLSDQILAEMNQLLSIWGMTALQYNALRVLYVKDTQDIGLPSKEIGKHLYTRVPDVTRLLDRLADKGWVVRERDCKNRRVVRTRLTPSGIELVESAYLPLVELESQQFSHMDQADKKELTRLLALALDNPDAKLPQ